MLSIHKTDICIENYISSTEKEDSVPQRQRFVSEFDVTYLQHIGRERSTAAPDRLTIYPSSFFYPVQAYRGAGAYLSCQRAITERHTVTHIPGPI